MTARKDFSDEQKAMAVVMYRCGETIDAIARHFGCSRQTLAAKDVLGEIPTDERRARMGNRAKGEKRLNQTRPGSIPSKREIKAACKRIRAKWPKHRLRRYEQKRVRIPTISDREFFG